MRLDKFLKVSRIIKRRPIAKIVVDGGKAKLNGKVAKASTEVKVGQILELEYFNKYFKFEILEVPTGNVTKEKTSDLINVLESRGISVDIDGEEDIFNEVLFEIKCKNKYWFKCNWSFTEWLSSLGYDNGTSVSFR